MCEALKYWNIDCISWKEFYQECKRSLSRTSENSLTAEEFEEYHPCLIDTTKFLYSQEEGEPFYDRTTVQEWERIEEKCKEVYGEAYEDEREECREAYGWF